MKVRTIIISFMATLLLISNVDVHTKASDSVTLPKDQLWLSPVNTGDCVAPRISAKKTAFVVELSKEYCARHNPDKAKEKTCLANSMAQEEFSFFTDRCTEDEFFIGINGKEVRLRKISKQAVKPHHFIGSFRGEGVTVEIGRPRQVGEITYDSIDGRSEDHILDASYEVRVVVSNGTVKKTFKGLLSFGR